MNERELEPLIIGSDKLDVSGSIDSTIWSRRNPLKDLEAWFDIGGINENRRAKICLKHGLVFGNLLLIVYHDSTEGSIHFSIVWRNLDYYFCCWCLSFTGVFDKENPRFLTYVSKRRVESISMEILATLGIIYIYPSKN